MQRLLASTGLLIATLGLAACAGTENRGVESVQQPVVSRADYALDLGVHGDGLGMGEPSRLSGWLASMKLGYGDRLSIDDGGAYNTGVRADIARQAARHGILVSDAAPVTVGAVAPGTVRVIVTRSRAEVPGCPDYSRMSQPNFDAHASSNFGCGTNSNLAAMVANPEDLVRGQDRPLVYDAGRGTKAIDTYREAEPTGKGGLKSESATGGSGGGSN
ncbi:pilus assembly protein CpaD [Sphingomonas gilva]|uniref:Pilus assembly protein CpaD n=1 Tax=Sphingomonas gilva TaxID=2305907 RepID=A0A396RUG3_9SPHN|nr:CpaD family pilus assembly protein [Sphingomonas gilva]RHW17341.1 pilus assembly protein CpaD [Sphingomonas gilva]